MPCEYDAFYKSWDKYSSEENLELLQQKYFREIAGNSSNFVLTFKIKG